MHGITVWINLATSNNNKMTATTYTPKIKVEVTDLNEQELQFIEAVKILLDAVTTDDCRKLASGIRIIAQSHKLHMVIGCGGSHIYIHRNTQWVCGDNPAAENIRFAIITDN